jgi:hypothetical protein
MGPDELLDVVAMMHTSPERVCYAYVCHAPGIIPGAFSRQAWLDRADAEREREIILTAMYLGTEDADRFIEIREVVIMKRGAAHGRTETKPATSAEPVHPSLVPCPGQVVLTDDEGQRGQGHPAGHDRPEGDENVQPGLAPEHQDPD